MKAQQFIETLEEIQEEEREAISQTLYRLDLEQLAKLNDLGVILEGFTRSE